MSAPLTQEAMDRFVVTSHADLDTVRALLEQDPRLLSSRARWDETPIQAATHVGSRHIVEFFLARGAPLDLYTAAMMGMTDRVRAFLQENPDLARQPGVHGIPSLFFPALYGHVEIAELLLRHGAEVNAGAGGNTPLHATALYGRAAMARWLLDHGADPAATDYEGKTALQRAEERGHRELTELLRSV